MNFERIKEILCDEAERRDIAQYEIFFTESKSVSTETLENEISSFASGTGAGVNFRCVRDGHMGSASTELFTEDELRGLVARAYANAGVIENNDVAVIFSGSDKYAECRQSTCEMPSAASVKALALDIQKRTYDENELVTDGTQSGVFAEAQRFELVNSNGLNLSNSVSLKGAFVQAVVSRDGEAQEAFDFSLGIDGAESISKKAVSEAISKLGASDVVSGKYDVIIDGKQMRAMLSAFASAFSGKNALLGLSLLAGKEGERVAAECVTLVDDPLGELNPVPTPFDGEGVATFEKNVIERGVLKTLLYDIATAHKADKTTSANGQRGSYSEQVHIAPFCFYIKGGELTDEELMGKMGDGIYVTELKGLHAGANSVTGDFSIESAGYLVEGGKKTKAVKGFTVAGNFFTLLNDIKAVGSEVKFGLPSGFTTFGSPSVYLTDMSIAGQ